MTGLKRIAARLAASMDSQLLLLLLALAMAIVAFSGPTADLNRDVYRFVFALDITQSMNVSDVAFEHEPVSRLEFAKQAVREALRRLPCGSQAGLAIFTEHRTFLLFAPVEVCENYAVLSTMLDRIDWQMAWAARSEVSKGLYSALDVTGQLGEETRLVFMTDGHEAPPVHPDFRPRFQGTPGRISGAIIGIGGTTPVPIPKLDAEGKTIGHWRAREVLQVDTYSLGRGATDIEAEPMVGVDMSDVQQRIARGTEHLSLLREAHLRRLAGETRLDYFQPDTAEALGRWLERSPYAHQKVKETNLSWLAGAAAILCLLLALVRVPWRRLSSGPHRVPQ